ncbi:SAM-dependent methyltransferase [Paracoccus laeviglucosivorans]|uniref:Nodulation protein S (NodS) n=1 Tax=Paracoccus laeviglucosivorans TaxID=1197861 RepID=A0A521FQC7_9RHOB|nr:SAM-dependent methyltransferase [Paracoccus laeviglucosivorans]SMO98326.1 Nodulation protein S (NodS) [Paracoccus laeviglucosivorans]
MPHERTLRHLNQLYAASSDPWRHRTSLYERAKYAATLEAIGPGPFQHALEIGCGNGTLLALLAPRCRALTGLDCTRKAVTLARAAVAHMPHVTVCCAAAPDDLPAIRPDLVVLSEVLYFLTPPEIVRLADWLNPLRARIVCVNWLGPTEEALDGCGALRLFAAALGRRLQAAPADYYRLDVFDGVEA